MHKPNRELKECETVFAPLYSKGSGGFDAKVSRLLRLGYVPLGSPEFTYHKDEIQATLTLIKSMAQA